MPKTHRHTDTQTDRHTHTHTHARTHKHTHTHINMGKAHNKSTLNSTNPTEDPYNEISKERSQDTNLRRTTVDTSKEIRELREENEKLRKDLEGDNDIWWKELRGEIEKLK